MLGLAESGAKAGRFKRGGNRIANNEPIPNPAIKKVIAVGKSY